MNPFVHLHVHTQYSLLDGQAAIKDLVDKAIADGMPGIAITDHGNMFGIKEFTNYVKKVNSKREKDQQFKAIVGCEMYVALESLHKQVDKKDTGRHLIVLAKNLTGYKNLIKIVSQAWTEGFYMHPRTDLEALKAHHEGLIVCSACLGGQLPRLIQAGRIKEAEDHARWFKEVFGDDYYIELQRHKTDKPGTTNTVYEIQQQVNPVLIDIARKLDIKLVATNDVHFTNEEDAEAHDRLICISTNSNLTDPNRMHYTKQEWMKSTAEMNEVFADIPEALTNTLEVVGKVENYSIDHPPIMPFFEIPADFGTEEEYRSRITEQELFDEFTRDENGNVVLSPEDAKKKIDKLGGYEKLYRIKFEADYLAKLAWEGAKKRYGEITPELKERIVFELHIMKTMGFPGYFLIVQDFIRAAREELGVSVGPGRGSAAGSCVAYCLGITQIDPIKYDLLFERFLNPDRISLPDIDIDFDDDGREEVLRYVTRKYGEEKVAHIITYGTMAAKLAIKDVARIEQLPLSESNRLTSLIPAHMPEVNGKELKPTLKNCYEHVPEFKHELAVGQPLVKEVLEFARRLEGNVRNTGVHACGVIICRDDITDWVPVSTAVDKGANGEKNKLIVTQYEGSVIEDTGLIKMDFLGLKTLSIIKEALHNIKLTTGEDVDIDNISLEDPKTYQLYCEGRTVGTFQFESANMQKYLRELQPSTFEDLIAMNALYRPGPMDNIPDFIARKQGRKPITYDIPEMEMYLKDTYGITVYQEQVMLLSRLLANFTRGQSDTLRKAMGKKLIDKMNALKELFFEGGQKNGHPKEILEKVWTEWEKFAQYAFNKSHATCYSWVAFQTAWLKANYPAEYMAAVLTRNLNDIKKLTVFMDECKKMHIKVMGPDVNESYQGFGVTKQGNIRFGMGAIKGVGENVVKGIVDARSQGGPFESIYDFVERVPSGCLNRRVLESLAMAGALDCFGEAKREDYFGQNARGETLSETLIRYGQAFQNDRHNAAMSLFGDDEAASSTAGRPQISPAIEWPAATRLEKERDLVGMYLSAHPLDPYYMQLNYGCSMSMKTYNEAVPVEGSEVTMGGMVIGLEERVSRKGGKFGILKVEDYSGSAEFRLFGQTFINFHNYGVPGTPILIRGKYERRFRDGDVFFNILQISLLSESKNDVANKITINLCRNDLNGPICELLHQHLGSSDENCGALAFNIYDPEINRSIMLTSRHKIPINRALVEMLQSEDIQFKIN